MRRFVPGVIGTTAAAAAALFLSLVPASAHAAEYYVDRNSIGGACSDSNSGTSTAQPFCTSTPAMTKVLPGDTVNFRKGSYPGFTIRVSGTETQPIIIRGYPGDGNYPAKIDVSLGSDSQGNGIYAAQKDNVAITNFEVMNAQGRWNAGIKMYKTSNFVVDGNWVHHNGGSKAAVDGILVSNGSKNTVASNRVHDNGFNGIHVESGSTTTPARDNIIRNNVSFSNKGLPDDSDGIQVEKSAVSGTLIIDNEVYGNADDGIDTWTSNSNTIERNTVYNNIGPGDGNGIKAGGSDIGGNNLVRFNISYGNKLNGFDSNGSGGNRYYHNVAYNNGNYGFEDGWRNRRATGCPNTARCQGTFASNIGYNNVRANFSAGDQTVKSDHNLWFTDGKGAQVVYVSGSTPFVNLPDFTAQSGGRLDANSISADPLFVSLSTYDFHLQGTSPAIDEGDPSNPGSVTVSGAYADIGRYEYQSASTVTAAAATRTSRSTSPATRSP